MQPVLRATALGAVTTLLLAACGGATGGGDAGYGADAGHGADPGADPSVASPTTGEAATVGTTEVAGLGAVLSDSKGFTLYHLTTERRDRIQCVRACARMWPPLLAPAGRPPAAASSLPGHLATIERPDGGEQITYDGWPLYTYSGDIAPSQANGQGVQDVWFAVGPGGTTEAAAGDSGGDPSGGGGAGSGGDYGGRGD